MSKLRETLISNCEKKFVLKCISEYMRVDGRAFDEFRELKIEFGKDWGSCYVSLGKTSVLAQVSCEVQQPKSSRPSEGILNLNLELNPLGAPHFEAGRQSEFSIQLNRLLEKCIKDSKAVDLESLCIKVNEKVWAIRVDINVINYEGNILDCASVATLAALAHFRRPDVTNDGEEIIIHTYAQRDPIPTVLHHYPICVSYNIFSNGEIILADPTLLEEGVAEGQLIFSLNAYKELCGLHLGGNALMNVEQILSCTSKATSHANIVIQQLKDALEKDTILRQNKTNVGFQNGFDLEKEFDKFDLNECINSWTIKKSKTKHQKENIKLNVPNIENNAQIQFLTKGSAVLIPTDNSNVEKKIFKNISEEESKDSSSQNVKDVITIESDGSEEDVVIVLNADNKTNKKKKLIK